LRTTATENRCLPLRPRSDLSVAHRIPPRPDPRHSSAVIAMLGTVALPPRQVHTYADLSGPDRLADLRALAAPLRGLRVLNLSLSEFGTGVPTLLQSAIPLLNDLGLESDWRVARPDTKSEGAIRSLYDGLNGDGARWSVEQRRDWEQFAADAAAGIESSYDLVVVHDPQLLGAIPLAGANGNSAGARWLWSSHLDLASADARVWDDLEPYAARCAAVMFEDPSFLPPGWQPRLVQIVPPAIDPLAPANAAMSQDTAVMMVREWGVDAARPLLSQIAPFNRDADVLGLIEVFDALAPRIPGLQLAIVPIALRDNEATRAYFDEIADAANERTGVILPPLGSQLGNTEVNAFRHVSTVVAQKSLQRGFALWLSEAMWRGRPVVAGPAAGTLAQVVDGVTGYVVGDTAGFAERTAALLEDATLRERLGRNARRHVANHLLITRYLADILQLYARVSRAIVD
jgi:trehalose synthase